MDVEAGDVPAVARSRPGRADFRLLERDRIAPVAERDAAIRTRRLSDPTDREPADGRRGETAGRALPTGRARGAGADARGRHLAAEEGERADGARGRRASVRPDVGVCGDGD